MYEGHSVMTASQVTQEETGRMITDVIMTMVDHHGMEVSRGKLYWTGRTVITCENSIVLLSFRHLHQNIWWRVMLLPTCRHQCHTPILLLPLLHLQSMRHLSSMHHQQHHTQHQVDRLIQTDNRMNATWRISCEEPQHLHMLSTAAVVNIVMSIAVMTDDCLSCGCSSCLRVNCCWCVTVKQMHILMWISHIVWHSFYKIWQQTNIMSTAARTPSGTCLTSVLWSLSRAMSIFYPSQYNLGKFLGI